MPHPNRHVVVYVAGPITRGDIHENVMTAFAAGMALLRAGLSPLVPHGSCFWGGEIAPGVHLAYVPEAFPAGTTAADWYGLGVGMVRRCDCVLRLPGDSVGADLEVAEARRLPLPVFHSVEEVIAAYS